MTDTAMRWYRFARQGHEDAEIVEEELFLMLETHEAALQGAKP